MLVERSILQPIFAGTQSAGLDKSENPEAPSFQQHFAETVEAIASGGRRLQQPIEQEMADALPQVETPPGQDEGQAAAETERAESAETAAPIVAGELALDAPRDPAAARLPETELQAAPAREVTEGAAVRPAGDEYARTKTSMLQELQRTDGALAELMIASPEQKPEADVAADAEIVPAAEPGVAVQKKNVEIPVVLQPPSDVDVKAPAVQLSAAVETEPAPVVEIKSAALVTSEAAAERAISDGLGGRQIQAEVVSIQVVEAGRGPDGDGRDDGVAMRAGPAALGPDPQSEPARSLVAEQRPQQSDPHEQVERIVRVIRASISRGGSRVTLRLNPPSLGPLRIQMQIRNGELIARFETQTEAARSWISSQLGSLREALAAQNIRLVGESVETRGQADSSNEPPGQQGDFSAGAQAGSRQPQEQRAAGHEVGTETDVPQWAETQADENQVNVVA